MLVAAARVSDRLPVAGRLLLLMLLSSWLSLLLLVLVVLLMPFVDVSDAAAVVSKLVLLGSITSPS